MKVLRCGDAGLLVEVDGLEQVLALYTALAGAPPAGVEELVPAARTLLLRLVPGVPQAPVAEAVERAFKAVASTSAAWEATGELVEITVVYDGPDLAEVAEITGLGKAGVVAAHTGRDWTVAFGGFAPGFGYLVGGDPRLHVPRRTASRTRVPAGAVAIAGEFGGVYPRASPGGWQLIGRTTLRMFDLDRDPPALLRPGVRVRFKEAEPPPAAGSRAKGASGAKDADATTEASGSAEAGAITEAGGPTDSGGATEAGGSAGAGGPAEAERITGAER